MSAPSPDTLAQLADASAHLARVLERHGEVWLAWVDLPPARIADRQVLRALDRLDDELTAARAVVARLTAQLDGQPHLRLVTT